MTLRSLLFRIPAALFFSVGAFAAEPRADRPAYEPPRFTDAGRRQKVEAALPAIRALFAEYATSRHVPGIVFGIVLDGELIHTDAIGFANVARKIPASAHTRFRIASMTKSFTALAIVKLRDAGRLSLDDAIVKFLPDFAAVKPLTADAPPVTVRHLLTMSAGFPEDNPWGDRQLADSVDELRTFLRAGVSLSTTSGTDYEYSNLGYALLGQIIATVAGEPYQRYITREILTPLGMRDTRWEYTEVPADQLALGYRWEDNTWKPEPLLGDGTYGAMGGLLTTMTDFARYVNFHLAAWPPRNDPDPGPVRRASVREMHRPAEVTSLLADARNLAGDRLPAVVGYGYGLRWSQDARGDVNVGHSGGLPGFGSNFRFFPDHGVAVISFANLTYAGMGTLNARAGAILLEKAGLPRRTLPPSAILATRTAQVAQLVQSWDPALAAAIIAENFFLDTPRDAWIRQSRETLARAGRIRAVGLINPENQLRGTFPLEGETGRVDVFFTLTPEADPRVQELRLTFVPAK